MKNIPNQLPAIMKALGDENRLKILGVLESGSLCACEVQRNLHISQSTLSHHMAILNEAGLVSAWSVGKWTHYRLCAEGLALAQSFIAQLHVSATSQTNEDTTEPSPACVCATETRPEARPQTEMSIA